MHGPKEMTEAIAKIDRMIESEVTEKTSSQDLPVVRVIEPMAKNDRCVLMTEKAYQRHLMIEALARRLIADDTEQNVRVMAEVQLRHVLG